MTDVSSTSASIPPPTLRRWRVFDDYIYLIVLKALHEYFTEDDGFLAQLSKFKLINWFEDCKEQLVDEFCWRIVAIIHELCTDEELTLTALNRIIGCYRLAHFKLVEAGLILVERQASSRKGLRVKNQAQNHFVPDHFEYNKVRALKNWFYENWEHPFPSQEVKIQLSAVSDLTVHQVQAWFINWRVRRLLSVFHFPSHNLLPPFRSRHHILHIYQ